MDIGEQLRGNFPNTIRKDKPLFSAMVSNPDKTGAIESVLNDVKKFGEEYSRNPDLYKQTGELLDKSISFLSFMERFTDESDDALKLRFGAIFKRNGDEIWGNPYDVKNVFKEYFPSATVYIVENVNDIDNNLLQNGDFQETTFWDYSDDSVRSKEARFSKTYGLNLIDDNSWAKQSITLENREESYTVKETDTYSTIAKLYYGNPDIGDYIAGYSDNPEILTEGDVVKIPARNVYFLHFFLYGSCGVKIKDVTNNRYWNSITESWEETETITHFESSEDKWDPKSLWIINDYIIEEIEITFIGKDGGYLDYARLFNKYEYPTFSVIAHFEGKSDDSALALGTGREDEGPIENYSDGSTNPPKYGNFGYFDGSFISGVASGFAQDIYEDLLEYVRADGVKAYIETINRDE